MKPTGAQTPRVRTTGSIDSDIEHVPMRQRPHGANCQQKNERNACQRERADHDVAAVPLVAGTSRRSGCKQHAIQPQLALIAEVIDADRHAVMAQAQAGRGRSRTGDPTKAR